MGETGHGKQIKVSELFTDSSYKKIRTEGYQIKKKYLCLFWKKNSDSMKMAKH
jgi:hypothetical protein